MQPPPDPPPGPTLAEAVGNADLFPILKRWDYFNHAGVSPLTNRAANVMADWAAAWRDEAILGAEWFAALGDARRRLARLFNADAAEIAVLKNTSEGIATVARGVDWRAGDRVVTTAAEYPSNLYPWMAAADEHGLDLVKVPERTGEDGAARIDVGELLDAAGHDRTRLVTVSHVQWSSGQRLDVARIGQFCRDRGILFGVDAIQTVGVCPVDVRAMNIDYLWAGCHKWMLGPMGVGVFYCRRELQDATRPGSLGWHSVRDPFDWGDIDLTLQDSAARYECGTPNLPGVLVLRDNLEVLQSVGVENIHRHVVGLGDRLIAGLRDDGWQIVSPRGAGEAGGTVVFRRDGANLDGLVKTLRREHKTELAMRSGRVRFAPHFYNTDAQVDRLRDCLRAVTDS